MKVSTDRYAKGMADNAQVEMPTLKYDQFQYGLFKKYLGPKVLEVGAGAGRITQLAVKDSRIQELMVTEPSDHFFPSLKKQFGQCSNVKLMQSEVNSLGDKYLNYFDSVFSVCVMEHIEDDRKFLAESLNRLKPGGRLIISVPAFQFLYSQLDRNIGHFRRYDKAMIRKATEGLGVTIESLQYSNLIGFFGSLYFSKIKKINYQGNESSKKNFAKIYHIFSEYFIPMTAVIESVMGVPFGLNLTVVLTKNQN